MPCFFQKHGEMITTPSSVFEIDQRNHDFIFWDSFTTLILPSGTVSYVCKPFNGINSSVEKFKTMHAYQNDLLQYFEYLRRQIYIRAAW